MKNFGISQIRINEHRSCFFIERAFGNLLIFADYLENFEMSFFQNRGGIYKQFLESSSSIKEVHGSIFVKFGASAVGQFYKEVFHELLPVERYGKDYVDPDLLFSSFKSKKIVLLNQRNKRVLILSSDFYLEDNETVLMNEKNIAHELLMFIQERKADYVFFTHFKEHSHWEIRPKNRVLNYFKKFFSNL